MSWVCQTCGGPTKVLSTRRSTHSVLRRRACTEDMACERFTTAEQVCRTGQTLALQKSIHNVRAQAKRIASHKESHAAQE